MLESAPNRIFAGGECRVCRAFTRPLLAFSLAFVLLVAARGAETPLSVAASNDNFPYSFAQPDGSLAGFAIDLFDAVAKEIQLPYRRFGLPSMEERNRFAAGDFDLRQLHSRENAAVHDAEYSAPVLTLRGALFVRRGEKRFHNFAGVARSDLRIAAPPQGYRFALEQGIPAARLVRASSPECLGLLARGEVDAALVTRFTGLAQIQHLGIKDLETVGPAVDGFTVGYCIAAHPGETEVIGRINEGIALLYQNGRYQEIYQKWFAHYEPAPGMSRLAVFGYSAAALAVGLLAALFALVRQRRLARLLAAQALELEESRQILAEAQAFAKVGHWRRALDPGGVSEWSAETYRIFGRDPAAGVPRLDELVAYAAPEHRELWSATLRRAAMDGTPYDLDVTLLTDRGERRVIHVRGRPVLDAQGRQSALFGTVQDVTAWRTAEAELRQSELFLRALYDSLPQAVTVGERRGNEWHILAINQECQRRFRLSSPLVPGTRLRDLGQPPERTALWTQLAERCVAENRAIHIESHRHEPPADFSFTALPLPGSEYPRCLVLTEEITERKRQEAELSQSRRLRAIGELVGGIAHEFNNLLTPVALNAEMLQAEWSREPELAAQLKLIADAARRSAELTRRLLTFGRKSDRELKLFDLAPLLASDVELIRRTIDRRIEIACDLPPDLPPLYLDSSDVHQVLLNLLLNARDTLQEKLGKPNSGEWVPRIDVTAAILPGRAIEPLVPNGEPPPPKWVRLSVRDNGMGMPPAVVERIFEPFYTTKQVGRGTGLGMATVWHILTEMGGRIDVDSRLGIGSSFHICLPVHAAPNKPASPAPAAAAPAPDGSSRRILLVEDEDAVAQVVEALLRRQGHTVQRAADGQAGWETLRDQPADFDLVVLDLNMPGLHGRELVRQARALPYLAPMIVMSGRIPDHERTELTALGATAILDKPFSIEELRRVVADAVTPR